MWSFLLPSSYLVTPSTKWMAHWHFGKYYHFLLDHGFINCTITPCTNDCSVVSYRISLLCWLLHRGTKLCLLSIVPQRTSSLYTAWNLAFVLFMAWKVSLTSSTLHSISTDFEPPPFLKTIMAHLLHLPVRSCLASHDMEKRTRIVRLFGMLWLLVAFSCL